MNNKTHFIDRGESKSTPVVLIHAFPLNHKMWAPQMEALTKSHRVIAYDIRGFGQSALGSEAPSIDLFASDLIELLDSLKISKAILVGLSMGGYIALRAKQLFPQRVHALVLADTRVEPDSEEAKTKRAQTIEKLLAGGEKEFIDGFLAGALSKTTQTVNPSLVAELKEIISGNKTSGICAALKAMMTRLDTSGALSQNQVATLILVGEDDTLTPLNAAQNMQNLSGDADLTVIKKAGHLSNLENSAAFNAEVLAFLANLH